ncbi:MAG: hypothetical protein Q9159_006798 [Coniocarpon cinnabarinum]
MSNGPPPGPWEFTIWDFTPEQHNVEHLNLYKEGGLCPVHLGDLYDDETYTVVFKLGYSGTSTVWLARDNSYLAAQESEQHPFQYVALKFLAANQGPHEAVILQQIHETRMEEPAYNTSTSSSSANAKGPHAGKQNIIRLLHTFSYESPNGIHQILVLPPVRPIRETMHAAADTPEHCLDIAQQTANGLAYLHDRDIVHGDLYANNVGYSIAGLVNDKNFRLEFEEPTLYPTALFPSRPPWPHYDKDLFMPEVPLDRETPKRIPKYLVPVGMWKAKDKEFESYTKKPQVCIYDFNRAFSLSVIPSEEPLVALPEVFCPPEYVYPTCRLDEGDEPLPEETHKIFRRHHGDARATLGEISKQVDIWALGCLVADLLGAEMLPRILGTCPISGERTAEVILKIDPDIPKEWERLGMVSNARQSIGDRRDEAHQKAWGDILKRWGRVYSGRARAVTPKPPKKRLEYLYFGAKLTAIPEDEPSPPPFDPARFEGILQLCQYMLRSDPRQRPSIEDVLERIDHVLENLPPHTQRHIDDGPSLTSR